ncbi:T9SS type A sorting domain-containing protein [candidate division WOR-3 bacterium]|nr:T9SS type A sorting domain-containing protein [candidate division WOR-3 bacterium]
MKLVGLLIAIILFISVSFLSGNNPIQVAVPMPHSVGSENGGYTPENPPPIDSLCLVFAGVDYGGNFNSPQAYPNAKHITNVMVGSYYFPVVIWETGPVWHDQSLYSYWDDMFKFWSYPDSFTTGYGYNTGRPAVSADSHGNLHFCFHQTGNPDGYEIFYARAILDTSAGIIQYTVERPGVMLSLTNGEPEHFPSMAIYGDTLIMIVWMKGDPDNAICYSYSQDGGDTWLGPFYAYNQGGAPLPGGWEQACVAPDPNTGDMWAAVNFDYTGNNNMDIVALRWNFSPGDTWAHELVIEGQPFPNDFPQCLPAIVVDYNSIPHIVFQENFRAYGGTITNKLSGFNGCGPCGTLFYTFRQGAGNWSTPDTIKFPVSCIYRNLSSGYPSAGIATDNTVYFTTTMPESAVAETLPVYLPFNVHYAEISPYTGALSYGGIVSVGDTTYNAIYGHITYDVPIGGEVPAEMQGPGITWSQMDNALPPTDIYYRHTDTLLAVEETKTIQSPSPVTLYQNYPNPAREKTMIRFTVPNNTNISLNIYDISGRLVKTLANGIPGASSSFVVWNGKNEEGKEVTGGVYLYRLKAGAYTETRKLLLIN